MLNLLDGPCKGVLLAKRAPAYLRAVALNGHSDCLDLVDDTPTPSETIHVYRREGKPLKVHLNFGGGKGAFYAMASYRHMPEVDGESLRETAAWQKWAERMCKDGNDKGT
jgi:hypothetical protein